MQVTTNRRIEIEIQLTYLPNVYFFSFVVGSQYSCSFTKVGVALVRVSILLKFRLDPNLTPCKGVCIPESRKFLLDESGIQLKESGIQVPLTKIWNPVPEIRNPRLGIQNPRLSWFPLHGAKNFLCFVFAVRKRKENFIISSCKGNYIV